jgi:hypothetical protein
MAAAFIGILAMTSINLVLALWTAVHPGFSRTSDARVIATAIAAEAHDEYEAALAAYYVLRESGVRLRPNAIARDALAGVSCGMLQEPCPFVARATPREQVRWWLREVRAGHLERLDSSPARAHHRFQSAMRLLARARQP